MSDLCHNCGDSHLPVPCKIPLKDCSICRCQGHTYVFCPLGATMQDRNQVYYMLCHNCDQWHMPEPCKDAFHECGRCGIYGHLEVFCPVDPTMRAQLVNFFEEHFARKRQVEGMKELAYMTSDNVTTIRTATCKEVFNLMSQGRLNADQILEYIAQPVAPMRNILPPLQNFALTGKQSEGVPPIPGPETHVQINAPSNLPSMADEQADAYNDYMVENQNRLDQERLRAISTALGTYQPPGSFPSDGYRGRQVVVDKATSTTLTPFIPSQPYASDEPPAKKQRILPKPRCEACKHSKRRCSHLVPDDVEGIAPANPAPSPLQTGFEPEQGDNQQSTMHYGHGEETLPPVSQYSDFHGAGLPGLGPVRYANNWMANPPSLLSQINFTAAPPPGLAPLDMAAPSPEQTEWLKRSSATMPNLQGPNRVTDVTESAMPAAPVAAMQAAPIAAMQVTATEGANTAAPADGNGGAAEMEESGAELEVVGGKAKVAPKKRGGRSKKN